MLSPPMPPPGTNAFYYRSGQMSNARWEVCCFLDNREADGGIVTESPAESDELFRLWEVGGANAHQPIIWLNPRGIGGDLAMWFVILEKDTERHQLSLVAFESGHFAPGTVINDASFFTVPVSSDQQSAAVRWFDDGMVDEIFVSPEARGRNVATALLYAASAYHQHRGFSGRLRSDGRRTQDGVSLVTHFQFPQRVAPLEKLVRTMDPNDNGEAGDESPIA